MNILDQVPVTITCTAWNAGMVRDALTRRQRRVGESLGVTEERRLLGLVRVFRATCPRYMADGLARTQNLNGWVTLGRGVAAAPKM